MFLSAELRWFWSEAPAGLEAWFRDEAIHGCRSGGGDTRVDRYLLEKRQQELGIKLRGSKPGVEIKGLVVSRLADSTVEPFAGPVQMWAKWSSEAMTLDQRPLLDITKRRHLRKFDTQGETPTEVPLTSDEKPADGRPLPEAGCNVELTAVTVYTTTWWTLGFESFGDLGNVERSLLATAEVLAQRNPPLLDGGYIEGYPRWISLHAPSS
jgi:hypothetical protein